MVALLLGIAGKEIALSQYLGVDRDGNLECDPSSEMTIRPAGERSGKFDLFFSDMPNPLGSVACTFCFHDSSAIVIDSFVYHTPEGWSDIQMKSDRFQYSSWISRANQLAKCYVVQSSDFTLSSPWDSPSPIGTVYYTAARDEPIHIILDPAWSAYFTIAYSNGTFCSGEKAVNDSCLCPTSAPTKPGWRKGGTLIR